MGVVAYATNIVFLLVPIASLALEPVAVREIVKRPDDSGTIVGTILTMRLIASVVSVCVALLVAFVLGPINDSRLEPLVLAASLALVFQTGEGFDYFLLAKLQLGPLVLARLLASVVSCVVKLSLIYFQADLVYFAAVGTIDAGFNALFSCFAFRYASRNGVGLRLSWAEGRRLLSDSAPLIASGFLVFAFLRLDQILVGRLSTATELGIFAVAVRVVDLWVFIPNAVMRALYPRLVVASQDDEMFKRSVASLFRYAFWGSVVAAAVLAGAMPLIIGLLFGSQFSQAAPVAMIFAATLIATFSGEVRAQVFFILNLKKYHVPCVLIGMVCLVALGIPLIPKYGALGAAASTALAYIISAVATSFLFRETRWIGVAQVRVFG